MDDHEAATVRVFVEAQGVAPTLLFSAPGITEIALSFDQNMNPFVAYTQGADAKFYWYDSTVPGMIHSQLPSGCRTLRCTMDERRVGFSADSDILLCYIRSGNFCIRYQRERYQTEHVLRSGVGASCELVSMARNTGSRVQWRFRNYARTDDPGALIQAEPFLSDVVTDLLLRSGVSLENVDVLDLFENISGYKVATPGGADAMIQPLRQAYFFDSAEYDRKLRFVKRGRRAPVATITDATWSSAMAP